MPNNNFDLVSFVNNQVTEVNREEVAQFMEDNKVNYVVFSALLEKAIMNSILKYQGTAQSKDLMKEIAIGVAPLMQKLNGDME
jgi:hypothetical protein|tara:strand:+ start:2071 stop:2319 length:249 start_codon:yes stop_codon:yes gene_type:complete